MTGGMLYPMGEESDLAGRSSVLSITIGVMSNGMRSGHKTVEIRAFMP